MTLPTLFLHAITRDRTDYTGFADLSGLQHATAIDLIGHGEAPRAPRYLIADYADAVLSALPQRAVLYGHSLGGVVALAVAASAPSRVGAIVLEDPPLFEMAMARMAGGPFERGFKMLLAQKRDPDGPKSQDDWARIVARWPSGRVGRTFADDGAEAVARRAWQLASVDPAVIGPMIDGSAADAFDPMAAIRATLCPIHVIAGERRLGAALTSEDCARLDAEPNVTLWTVPGAGHYPREAEPLVCAKLLADVNRRAAEDR